ncbi:nucleotidyltransferase family protein [Porcipelethomonas sp.]|uniref:tRNA(Met) cytidine acetate ligase n=1 Tax=Porcipelethomonas sp. TaxID=2981675 RepID=UPI003EF92AD8
MKITGIVCEYNPFHNGHFYHVKKTRENGATHIAAIMSGNYVQRGDTAVLDKFTRAGLALKCGADLVIEIPSVYSLSSAEFYARGAVYILDSLGCVDEISFGSEVGSVAELERAAEIADECSKSPELEEYLRNGMSYPNAINTMVYERLGKKLGNRIGDILSSPNNVLAVEYLKALKHFNSSIKPFTVQRKSAAHDSMTALDGIASASFIRKCMTDKSDFSSLVPDYVSQAYTNARAEGKTADISNLERIIIYKLRTSSPEELRRVPDVGQGLEYRILEAADKNNLEEILMSIKTKRYTMARLKRIFLNMLIGITKSDLEILPPYGRILAVSERGRDILAKVRETGKIPFSTSLARLSKTSPEAERFARIEGRASDIYALAQDKIGKGQADYRARIGIKTDEQKF